MAKIYNFYNEAGTINVEVVTDAMLEHETFHVTEIRNSSSTAVQDGFNFDWLPNTESTFVEYAKDHELGLKIFDDTTLVSDVSGGVDFLTFSLVAETDDATIDTDAHTIDIEVAHGTTVTALVATFTLSPNATAVVGSTAQVSGTTANNFTSPVTYTITSEAGLEQEWVVTVTVAAS